MNYIGRYADMPFHLGFNDCFLLCLRWADKERGESMRSLYSYSSERDAIKIIRDAGCDTAPELFDKHYAQTNEPKLGDLVEFSTPHVLGGCAIYAGDGVSYTILVSGEVGTIKGFKTAWAV